MDKIVLFILRISEKQTGLSQKAFAQAVDLPTRTYRSYETGERGLTIDKFRELKERSAKVIPLSSRSIPAHGILDQIVEDKFGSHWSQTYQKIKNPDVSSLPQVGIVHKTGFLVCKFAKVAVKKVFTESI